MSSPVSQVSSQASSDLAVSSAPLSVAEPEITDPTPRWTTSRLAAWLMTVCLLILIGHAAAHLALRGLLTEASGPLDSDLHTLATPDVTPADSDLNGTTGAAPGARSLGQRIASLNLFGRAAQPVSVARVSTPTRPKTTLKLKLNGVFIGAARGDIAFISDPSQNQRPFRVGGDVFGQASLTAIQPDFVVLQRNGREELLYLKGLPERTNPRQAAQAAPASQTAQTANPGAASGSTRSASGPGATAASRRVSTPAGGINHSKADRQLRLDESSELGEWLVTERPKWRENPLKLAEVASFSAVMKGGHVRGYQLKALNDFGLLKALDIRPKDVVTEINGQPLNTTVGARRALQSLTDSDDHRLTLRRDGKRVVIAFSIQPG